MSSDLLPRYLSGHVAEHDQKCKRGKLDVLINESNPYFDVLQVIPVRGGRSHLCLILNYVLSFVLDLFFYVLSFVLDIFFCVLI